MLNNSLPPRIDQWYQDEASDLSFTVIDLDSVEGIIEIRYFDGEIGVLSMDDWEEMPIAEIEQPDEWPWPADEFELGDPDYDEN